MSARTARTAKATTARTAKAATAKVPTISRTADGGVILTDLPYMVAGLGTDGAQGRSSRVMGARGLGWTFQDETDKGGLKGWITNMPGAASLVVDTFALVGLEIIDLSGKGAKAAAPAKAATAKAAPAKAATAKAATAKAATAKAATAQAATAQAATANDLALKIAAALVAAGIDDESIITAAIMGATAKAAPAKAAPAKAATAKAATAKAATAKAATAKAATAKAATAHTVTVPAGTRVRAAIKIMRAAGAQVARDGRTLTVTGLTVAKINAIVAAHAA